LLGETTIVTALEGVIKIGLVMLSVPPTTTLRVDAVAFFSWKNVPPFATVTCDAKRFMLLNPEFVI